MSLKDIDVEDVMLAGFMNGVQTVMSIARVVLGKAQPYACDDLCKMIEDEIAQEVAARMKDVP